MKKNYLIILMLAISSMLMKQTVEIVKDYYFSTPIYAISLYMGKPTLEVLSSTIS